MSITPTYRRRAIAALTEAVGTERDFADFLARVLAVVAANAGSVDALTAGRPGSWESSILDQLVRGTVGDDLPEPSDPGARAAR